MRLVTIVVVSILLLTTINSYTINLNISELKAFKPIGNLFKLMNITNNTNNDISLINPMINDDDNLLDFNKLNGYLSFSKDIYWNLISNYCLNTPKHELNGYCLIKYDLVQLLNDVPLTYKLILNISDADLNVPQLPLNINLTINRNLPLNTQIVLVESTREFDKDSKKYRINVDYWLDDDVLPFSLIYDRDQEKLLLKIVDYFEFNEYTFKLNAGFRFNYTTSKINIKINDESTNDDRPMFTSLIYNFTIEENTPINAIIGSVKAMSNLAKYQLVPILIFDSTMTTTTTSPLSISNYSFNDSSQIPIDVNSSTGSIYIRSNLDRESYLINNEADYGLLKVNIESQLNNKYAYCQVNIIIKDINDNSPQIRVTPLNSFAYGNKIPSLDSTQSDIQITNIYINENTQLNQIVAYLSINDPDAGENGTISDISMKIVHTSQKTHQQPNSLTMPLKLNKIRDKVYTLKLVTKLDYEAISYYSIELTSKDNGSRVILQNTILINLFIQDFNDNIPKFQQDNLNTIFNLNENDKNQIGKIIGKVNAIDLDSGLNGLVKYSITNDEAKGYFNIDDTTGDISLKRVINREIIESDLIELKIMAQDEGTDFKLNNNLTIKVNIIDVNDNQPKFDQDEFNILVDIDNIKLTNDSFAKVATFYVTDADSFRVNSIFYAYNSSKYNYENDQFIFKENLCLKTLNFEIIPKIDYLNFLIENVTSSNAKFNFTKCMISLYINIEKFNQTIKSNSEISFNLKAQDYGIALNTTKYTLFRLRFTKNLPKLSQNSLKIDDSLIEVKHECLNDANIIHIEAISVENLSKNDLNQISRLDVNMIKFEKIQNSSIKQCELTKYQQKSALEFNGVLIVDIKITFKTWQTYDQLVILSSSAINGLDLFNDYKLKQFNLMSSNKEALNLFNLLSLKKNTQIINENLKEFFANLSTDKSSLLQFIIITICILISSTAFLICCITLIIKHNKSTFSNKKTHSLNSNNQIKCYDNKSSTSLSSTNHSESDNSNKIKQQQPTNNNKIFKEYTYCLSSSDDSNCYRISVTDYNEKSQNLIFSPEDKIVKYLNGLNGNKESEYKKVKIDPKLTCNLNTGLLTASTCNSSTTSTDDGCYGSSDVSSERDIKYLQKQLSTNFAVGNTQKQNQVNFNFNKQSSPLQDFLSITGSYV